jgi:beta-glucosidase
VYLDGKLLVQRDNVHERGYEYETVDLEAGKLYPIRVDFHEVHGDADIRLVWAPPHPRYEEEALKFAREADVIIMTLGLSPRLEGEEMKVKVDGFSGGDRVSLDIPKAQEDLLERVSALGKPVVLVLLNGSAVAVNWARDHVPAIVELWYPGQAGGTALADVLFGDYNPAGRLPVTFYQSADQLPPFGDYNMKGRTYRYFEGNPLYPFGYGLSYTTFGYRNLQLSPQADTGENVRVSVEVENTGKVAGEEVVQLYLKHVSAAVPVPVRSLQGFRRVSLKPGEKTKVDFTLDSRQLSYIGGDNRRVVPPGEIEISVGGKQPGFRGPADASTTEVVTGKLLLTGQPKLLD